MAVHATIAQTRPAARATTSPTVSYHFANRGGRRWLRTFPGTGISLAYNPVTGDVIVTGASSRCASRGNYTTIAYHG